MAVSIQDLQMSNPQGSLGHLLQARAVKLESSSRVDTYRLSYFWSNDLPCECFLEKTRDEIIKVIAY